MRTVTARIVGGLLGSIFADVLEEPSDFEGRPLTLFIAHRKLQDVSSVTSAFASTPFFLNLLLFFLAGSAT